MGQVLIRGGALFRRPSIIVLLLLWVAGGCALVRLPLFGLPGFELSLAMSILTGILGGPVGIAAARQEGRLLRSQDPRPKTALRQDSAFFSVAFAMAAAFFVMFVTVALPFLVATGFALARSHCNPFAQVGFYPLLVLPSAALAAAVGGFCGFATRTRKGAAFLYGLFVLASGIVTAYPLIAGPQVFAFNHFLGYYPGPLYDEALQVRPALLWFRYETLLVAGVFFALTAVSLHMKDGRLSRPHVRLGSGVLLALLALQVALLEDRAPDLGLRMSDAYLAQRLGGVRDTAHFRIHYPRGKATLEVDRLARDLEFRYAQISEFLGGGVTPFAEVFVYRSADEKQELVGAAHTQFAQPWRHALHINDAPFPHPVAKHELVHVLAAPFGKGPFKVTSRLGVIPIMAIVEGFAVAVDNPVGDLTLHEWAAAMRREKLAPDLRALFGPGGFYTSAPARAYTSAGSFLRFLAEQHGADKLKALYADGDFERVYKVSLDSLVTEWEKSLDALPLDDAAVNRAFARFREGSLFTRDCAREVAALGDEADAVVLSDPGRAATLYARCAELQPHEPSFRFGEARALARLDRTADAKNLLDEVAHEVQGKPALEAEAAMALADLAWQRGRSQDAASALEKVLSLKPGPDLERTARVKLAAASDEKVGPAIFEYLRPGNDDVRLLKLQLALDREPENAILNYLLGRRLVQVGMPGLAVKRLELALKSGTLPEAIEREALRLHVEGLYENGDCAGVKDAVGRLPDLGTAFRAAADEWSGRCDFEQRTFHALLVPEDVFDKRRHMKFEKKQLIDGTVDEVEKALLDERYPAFLLEHHGVLLEVEPQERKDEGSTVRRKIRYRPKPVIKSIGPKTVPPEWFAFIETSTYDRARKELRFTNTPTSGKISKMLVNTGVLRLKASGQKTERTLDGDIKLVLPFFLKPLALIGEKVIESEGLKILDAEVPVLNRFIAEIVRKG